MVLGDFFDLEHLNNASRSMGYAEIITRKDFLGKGFKNVTLLKLKKEGIEKLEWSYESNGSCYSNPETPNGFCTTRVISTTKNNLTAEKMQDIWGKLNNESIILAISGWRGPTSLASECAEVYRGLKHQFRPSPRLLQDSQQYNKLFIGHRDYTAIMIRLEHVVMAPAKYSIRDCLNQVIRTASELKHLSEGIPMLAADIGKYGSNSWHWSVKNKENLAVGKNYAC